MPFSDFQLLTFQSKNGIIQTDGNSRDLTDFIREYGDIYTNKGTRKKNVRRFIKALELYIEDRRSADLGSLRCIFELALGKPNVVRTRELRTIRQRDFKIAFSGEQYKRYVWEFPDLVDIAPFHRFGSDKSGGEILRSILRDVAPKGTGERVNGGVVHAFLEEIMRRGLQRNVVVVDTTLAANQRVNMRLIQAGVSAYAGVSFGPQERGVWNTNTRAISRMFNYIISSTRKMFTINETDDVFVRPLSPYDYALFKKDGDTVQELSVPGTDKMVPRLGVTRGAETNELKYTGKERMNPGTSGKVTSDIPDEINQERYKRNFRIDAIFLSQSDLDLWRKLSGTGRQLDVYGMRLIRNVCAIEFKTTDRTEGDAPLSEAMSVWYDYVGFQFSGVLFVIVTTRHLAKVCIFQFSTNSMYRNLDISNMVLGIEPVYIVEKIIGKRITNGKIEYKIEWRGYKTTTFESAEQLENDLGTSRFKKLVDDFEQR